jgi:hypothetical protein
VVHSNALVVRYRTSRRKLLFRWATAEISRQRLAILPPVILWAWERPEYLGTLDIEKFGVAFLAQTLTLSEDDVRIEPRRQPLNVRPAQTYRRHSYRGAQEGWRPNRFERCAEGQYSSRSLCNARTPGVVAIQIDYDVVFPSVSSIANFLLTCVKNCGARAAFDDRTRILCLGDRWLEGLPVDEAYR